MNRKDLYQSFNNIDDDILERSERNVKKNGLAWVKWGAVAACLCIVAGIGFMNMDRGLSGVGLEQGRDAGSAQGSGAGIDMGGNDGVVPEGVDPVVASLAVLPAGVDLREVADATSVSISENDARAVETLGDYIPNTLPEGCRYGTAGYYETTMKDGTRYHMLRITYDRGQISVPVPKTENEESASEMGGDTAFLWMVWGHRPDTDLPVYQPEEITVSLIEQQDGRVFYVDYDGIYVGVEQISVSAGELFAVIESIE